MIVIHMRIEIYEKYIMPKSFVRYESDGWNFYPFNSEPNEPNVLECKDKMINEVKTILIN